MRFKKWNIGTPAERDVALLRSAGYPYLLSTVLAARGVTTAEAAAEALVEEIRDAGGTAIAVQADVGDSEQVASLPRFC